MTYPNRILERSFSKQVAYPPPESTFIPQNPNNLVGVAVTVEQLKKKSSREFIISRSQSRRIYPLVTISPRVKKSCIRFNPETQQRSLDALQWGMIPYWAKDPKIEYKMINARVETVDTASSYRQAFRKRRCLIPADGFYEWKKVVGS